MKNVGDGEIGESVLGWPWLLWALSLSMFAVGTTSLVVLGIGQEITTKFEVSAGAAGWLMTLFAGVFAVAAPLAQWYLHGRWTYPRIVQTGLLLLAAGLFWASLANSFVSLLLSRGLAAFGGALIAPTSAALAINLVPDNRRGRALATVFAGFTLASVVGVPLGTWLGLSFGWRGAMAMIGCLALVALAAVTASIRPISKRVSGSQLAKGLIDHSARSKVIAILATTIGVLGAQFTIYAVMAAFLMQGFGLAPDTLPFALLAFGIAGVAGNAAAGIGADRLGAHLVVWISLLGLGCMFLMLFADLRPSWAAAILAGCALCGTLFAAPQQARLSRLVSPDRHGLLLAFNVSASYVGIALGSTTASMLYDDYGPPSITCCSARHDWALQHRQSEHAIMI